MYVISSHVTFYNIRHRWEGWAGGNVSMAPCGLRPQSVQSLVPLWSEGLSSTMAQAHLSCMGCC